MARNNNNNHSYFTWDTPTDSLVLLQEAQGRCVEENLRARQGMKPATSRLVITYADHLTSVFAKLSTENQDTCSKQQLNRVTNISGYLIALHGMATIPVALFHIRHSGYTCH